MLMIFASSKNRRISLEMYVCKCIVIDVYKVIPFFYPLFVYHVVVQYSPHSLTSLMSR